VGFPDIQRSLGTDENVSGLAGIPGTTYGNRGDESLRTVAWVGENTLFITGKTSESMLGLYHPCLRDVGGKGWAAAMMWKLTSSQGPLSLDAVARIDLG